MISVGYHLASSGNGTSDLSPKDEPAVTTLPENPMKLDKTVYSPNDTMVMTITNNGNANFTTGYAFKLYKLENGTWKEVPVNLMFIEIAIIIEPGKSWEQRVKLSSLNLKPGHYKIEKTVVVTEPVNKMSMGIKAWAEFDVRG
nr:immunoglobulin-like domain-containing protein [Thermococcus sp. MAR1]